MVVVMTETHPGKWLQRELEMRSLTLYDAMTATGVRTPSAVYRWFDGNKPKDEHAAALAELLGVPELEVRWRFGLYIPKALLEEAQAERELLALHKLARPEREQKLQAIKPEFSEGNDR